MYDAPLVRERSRVRFSPAAPFSPFDYKVIVEGRSSRVVAEQRKNSRPFVARNWQGDTHLDYQDVLYRYYDEEGVLLYIGISNQMRARDDAHWSKPWRSTARMLCLEGFPDRHTCEVAERLAILSENPVFNAVRRYEVGARMWRYPKFVAACEGCLRGCQWEAFILPDEPIGGWLC